MQTMPMGDFENEMYKLLNSLPDLTAEQRETIVKTASNSIEQADKFGRLKSAILESARAAVDIGLSRVTLEIMIMDCFNHQCDLNREKDLRIMEIGRLSAHPGKKIVITQSKNNTTCEMVEEQ